MGLLAPTFVYLTLPFLAESNLWKLTIFVLLIVENYEEVNKSEKFAVNNLYVCNNILGNNLCESGLIATIYKKIYGGVFRTLLNI